MCLNEWRLGRLIRPVFTSTLRATGQSVTILANRQRVGLTITTSGAGVTAGSSVGISVDGVDIGSLKLNEQIKHWTLSEHGELPTRSFLLSVTGGTVTVCTTEYFAPEKVLEAAMRQFEAGYYR